MTPTLAVTVTLNLTPVQIVPPTLMIVALTPDSYPACCRDNCAVLPLRLLYNI